MSGARRRRRLGAAVAASVLLLAGCSDEASAETSWADDVCSAWSDLGDDLRGLTDGLNVDSLSQESLDELRSELEDRAGDVQDGADELSEAIEDVPDGADQAVENARQELADDADDVRAGLDAVGQALQGLTGATSAEGLTAALSEAQAGLTQTGQALSTLGDTVAGFLSAADDTLRQAFDDAPACQETRTGGTPS
ncbi:hypothetical protein [Jiangella alkaliphila]|uniref:hypothetical protein n=1 Tax=Jiangella alkaliphila TaxID=419479 RepID=UPI00062901A6|nr:hypothetical protein [Jiangella alkaliphila]